MAFYNEKMDDHTNFVTSFTRSPQYDFGVYARGYARAAKLVSEAVIASVHFPDYEAYPVVFLYRHALELYLKSLIYKLSLVGGFRGIPDLYSRLYNRHDLRELADRVSKALHILLPTDSELAKVVDRIVTTSNEFSQIDSDSYSYRYPIDTKGDPSTVHHQIVNLASLASHMNSLLEEVEVIDFGMDIEIDVSEEMRERMESLYTSL